MAAPVCSYSMLPIDLIPSIQRYLPLPEAMKYSRVDRSAYEHSQFFDSELHVVADRLNRVMASIQFSKFPELCSLSLGFGNYPEEFKFPRGLGGICRLVVDMTFEQSANPINRLIESMPGLTSLSLFCCSWAQPPSVQHVEFSSLALSNLAQLRSLDLGGNEAHPDFPVMLIGSLANLVSVNLSGQVVSDRLFRALIGNRSLSNLNLINSKSPIPRSDHSILSECRSLKTFFPGGEIDGEDLIAILFNNPGIVSLNLSRCHGTVITDTLLEVIGEKNLLLQELVFPRDLTESTITGPFFVSMAYRCTRLEVLDLGEFAPISVADISRAVELCGHLKKFWFEGRQINDRLLFALSEKLTLVDLSIPTTDSRISVKGLRSLQHLKHLVHLNVRGLRYLNDANVRLLVDSCRKLKVFRIDQSKGLLTYATFDYITSKVEAGASCLELLSASGKGLIQDILQLKRR
jgi:hypothetical protein